MELCEGCITVSLIQILRVPTVGAQASCVAICTDIAREQTGARFPLVFAYRSRAGEHVPSARVR